MCRRYIVSLLTAISVVSSLHKGCDYIKPCKCFKTDRSGTIVDCHATKVGITKACRICKTVGNVRILDLSNNTLSHLPNNCFEHCNELEELSLAHNDISVLEIRVFKGLMRVKSLNLDSNKLIHDGHFSHINAFEYLKQLRALSIKNNLHSIDTTWSNMCDLCAVMHYIKDVDFSENNVHEIPPRCFANCSHIENLSLASNNVTEIDKYSFEDLKRLKYLNLDNNNVMPNGNLADPDMFQPLINLQELHVQKNVMIKTDTACFTYFANIAKHSLVSLRSLYLDGLPNSVFAPQFQNFTNLTEINFSGETSYCYMFTLSRETFQNTPYLAILDLSHCNLSDIYKGAFENLSELKYLNLSYNMALGFPSLRNVSYGLQFTKIEMLDYSKVYKTFGLTNQLNRCDAWYLQNTTLKELHVNSNRVASVEINGFALLPLSLEVLVAEDNKFSFGPNALQVGCITNLKRLEMSGQSYAHSMANYNSEWAINENKMDTSGGCDTKKHPSRPNCQYLKPGRLEPWKFTAPSSLEVLNYRSSNLRYEKPAFKGHLLINNTVESIDFSNNILYSWTDHFIDVRHLKRLNVSRNFGTYVSGEFFRNCPNLENLDASYNKIGPQLAKDKSGSIFQYIRNLKVLNISYNWIDHLPKDIFTHLGALEVLDLSLNKLDSLDLKFLHMNSLSTLNLQQNKLSTLPLDLMHQLDTYSKGHSKHVSVDLTNNKLDGACGNIEFLSWMIDHPQYFANINEYEFLDKGHNVISYSDLLNSFAEFQKGCQIYTTILIVSFLFIASFVLIIIGGIIHRYRWRLRYLYYMAKAKYNGYIPVRGPDDNIAYEYDVFLSYANEDYQFATGEMYTKLEEAGLSMCLHQKDFLPGSYIDENILQAIRKSRKTLILLSPSFLESKWCIYEFNMARIEGIYSRKGETVLFVVMYQEVDITLVSSEMQECLESESYLAFPHDENERPYFWRLLLQALQGPGYQQLE